MDKKLKTKWVKALRSGKYKQARGLLRDHSGAMCCLGVLATIQGCNLNDFSENDLATTDLPVGFNSGLKPHQRKCLGIMNDGDDGDDGTAKSFKEIADYIEKNL